MPKPGAWGSGYVDSFWLTTLQPFSMADALRLFVGVPLPDRENSVRSCSEGSRYMATGDGEDGGSLRPDAGHIAGHTDTSIRKSEYITPWVTTVLGTIF